MNETENKFPCFLRTDQVRFRRALGSRSKTRITNRSFTDATLPKVPQVPVKRRAMSELEVSEVIKVTGAKPYLEERFV